ncbi:MAG TPA: class I SAM-dependent methyltransferase [Chitinispirillaceae bacterium]|nr:class I SAM-dependent methyltransferase [Chitinispirillaceae bacterium]
MNNHLNFCILLLSVFFFNVFSDNLDVPFVPTPYEVVNEMLNISNVDSNDILYDLGCGDGRIVITAVSQRGVKKGVGVDLDPQRIEECKSNASRAGVSNKVTFIQGNLFNVDFSEATVLTLYLLPDVNLKLRSKIFNSLESGSRVVSHDFDMGSWTPDKEQIIGNNTIYFWVIPANVSGSWTWQMTDTQLISLNVTQRFQNISAKASLPDRDLPVSSTIINGSFFTFSIGDTNSQIIYSGTVIKNNIKGKYRMQNGKSTPWTATRNPSTIQNIAPDENILGVD